MGGGETPTNQASALLTVPFTECVLPARHRARHFTGTKPFNSQGSPVRYVYYPSSADEETETLTTLPGVTQAWFSALSCALYCALYGLAPAAKTSLKRPCKISEQPSGIH